MPRPRKISREAVVEAAYRRVAAHGLEALSMRGLGNDLGVEAMSLYKHVGRREDLVHLLREELFTSIEFPNPTGSARRDLDAICRALFRGLSSKAAAAFLLRPPEPPAEDRAPESGVGTRGAVHSGHGSTPPWLPIFERMLHPLRELVPEPLDRAYAVHALFCFVLGQVVFSARTEAVGGEPLNAAAQLHGYPEVALIRTALQKRSPEVEFELGLRALLDSIEGRRGF